MSDFSERQLAAIIGSPISKPPYGMPKNVPSGKSAEEKLKKALEYAYQGMEDYDDYMDYEDGYRQGKYHAYELMAAHLEMLIKEAKNA